MTDDTKKKQQRCNGSTKGGSIQEYRNSNGQTMYRVNNIVGCSSRMLAEAFAKANIF